MLLVFVQDALDTLDVVVKAQRLKRRDDVFGCDRLLLVLLARVISFGGDEVDEL